MNQEKNKLSPKLSEEKIISIRSEINKIDNRKKVKA